MDAIHARYQQLEEKVRASNPHADTTRLRAAFEYANAHHGQQLRKSGEPYITHPIAVAELVADLGLDMDSITVSYTHLGSRVSSSSTATSARSIRPAALIRGARP